MKNLRSFQRGITMIEVMVSVAIIAIVMAVGVPSLSSWMQNIQVRSTAESVLTGIQLARGEAVRQNRRTQFTLTGDKEGSASWSVAVVGGATIQTSTATEMGANARLGVSTASQSTSKCCVTPISAGSGMGSSPRVIFDSFGRIPADGAGTVITRIDVTKVDDTGANDEENNRRMVILISPFGSAMLCKPSLPANSQGCP